MSPKISKYKLSWYKSRLGKEEQLQFKKKNQQNLWRKRQQKLTGGVGGSFIHGLLSLVNE